MRPPSTVRTRGRRGTKSRSKSKTPPLLLHEHRPPQASDDHTNQPDAELELDLESLGLEDREIPPDKLTKLEKIGSGGFKDVYVGRFKGRRVAIAEFRDQLSSSVCCCHLMSIYVIDDVCQWTSRNSSYLAVSITQISSVLCVGLVSLHSHAKPFGQLGVSLPENPRESPVIIVSELCANGDLFDYVRNVPAPSLYKVVRPYCF